MDDRILLTVDDAAVRLSMGRTLVYQKVLSGEIASVKIGRSRRIPVMALTAYVERLREKAKSDAV